MDTSTAAGKAFFDMLGVFAEFETNLRRERQAEGIKAATRKGVYQGRPPKIDIVAIQARLDAGISPTEVTREMGGVNRHSTVTHYQRPTVTQLQEGGTGGEVSEILFFSAKSKRRPSLIYSMQIIPVCLSIVARRKGVSETRRGGLNWTPISLLVGHPCKLFHNGGFARNRL